MNIKLRLRNPKSTEPQPITIWYHFNNHRFHYPTKEKILPQYWDSNEQRVKEKIKGLDNKQIETHQAINKELVRQKEHLQDLLTSFKKAGTIVTPELLRINMDKELGRNNQHDITNLIQLADRVIKDSEEGIRLKPKTKQKISWHTIRVYKTTKWHLEEFKKQTRYNLNLDNINMNFYNAFLKYFRNIKRSDDKVGSHDNTIGVNIKHIKTFMNYAYDNGWTKNNVSDIKGFERIQVATEAVYLSEEEIEALYNLDLEGRVFGRLKNARDLFIIACWTGVRYADLSKLSLDNVKISGGKKLISVKTQKTGESVYIPLHWMVEEIMKKYNGMPRIISNQRFNQYIKDLCKFAEFNETVHIDLTDSKEPIKKEKWEMVTCHTARRSFATNLYLRKYQTISIMNVTGHKSEKSFLRYIRIDPEQHAWILAEGDVWGQPKMKVAK